MRQFRHLLALGAALVVGGTMIDATAAHAQSAGYYSAVPVAQPTRTSLITRETLWKLQGNAFVAARAPDRVTVLCEMVSHSTGALTSFSAGGKAFDADQLAKCNAHAKGGAAAGAAVAQAR